MYILNKAFQCLQEFLKVAKTDKFHDRFIIIDDKYLYHVGASLKDLGKRCFGTTKIEDLEYIEKLINNVS